MAQISTSVGKHEVSLAGALLATLVPTRSTAINVPDRDGRRFKQAADSEIRHLAYIRDPVPPSAA